MPRLVIHFARYGPYHHARLRAAQVVLLTLGWEVIGLETAGTDATYAWDEARSDGQGPRVFTAFPGRVHEQITAAEYQRVLLPLLDDLRPDAMAIAGWGSPDARQCLSWCRKNQVRSIVMSETRAADGRRVWWKEWIKRYVISKFDGALVGGKSHRDYLVKLGIPAAKIQLGYNVVDNAYFAAEAERWREELFERRGRVVGCPLSVVRGEESLDQREAPPQALFTDNRQPTTDNSCSSPREEGDEDIPAPYHSRLSTSSPGPRVSRLAEPMEGDRGDREESSGALAGGSIATHRQCESGDSRSGGVAPPPADASSIVPSTINPQLSTHLREEGDEDIPAPYHSQLSMSSPGPRVSRLAEPMEGDRGDREESFGASAGGSIATHRQCESGDSRSGEEAPPPADASSIFPSTINPQLSTSSQKEGDEDIPAPYHSRLSGSSLTSQPGTNNEQPRTNNQQPRTLPYFLTSNRFIERKNLARLVEAYASYLQPSTINSQPSTLWNLCLLGDGELKADLIAQCHRLGLQVAECAPWEVPSAWEEGDEDIPAPYHSRSGEEAPPPADASSIFPSTINPQLSTSCRDEDIPAPYHSRLSSSSLTKNKEQRTKNSSSPTIFFPGFRQIGELPRFYAHAGCFVHPALEEPWGLVINEAMACGLPVLSGDNVGAAEELIDDGVNGWVFDAADVDAMAECLGQLAGLSDVQRLEFGQASRRILEERCATEAFGRGLAALVERS